MILMSLFLQYTNTDCRTCTWDDTWILVKTRDQILTEKSVRKSSSGWRPSTKRGRSYNALQGDTRSNIHEPTMLVLNRKRSLGLSCRPRLLVEVHCIPVSTIHWNSVVQMLGQHRISYVCWTVFGSRWERGGTKMHRESYSRVYVTDVTIDKQDLSVSTTWSYIHGSCWIDKLMQWVCGLLEWQHSLHTIWGD